MPEVRDRVVVPVGLERAWDFAADIRNAPRWVFGIREISGDLRHPLQPGDRLRVRLFAGGRMADSDWVVGESSRPHLLSSTGRGWGAEARLRIECRALGPESTEVTQVLAYQLPGGPLGQLAARLGVHGVLEMQAHRSLRTLRRLLSAEAGAGRAWPSPALDPEPGGHG
ncbi:MAG: SRPBCC family protein [Candidatus Dormibacteria bacterium]